MDSRPAELRSASTMLQEETSLAGRTNGVGKTSSGETTGTSKEGKEDLEATSSEDRATPEMWTPAGEQLKRWENKLSNERMMQKFEICSLVWDRK